MHLAQFPILLLLPSIFLGLLNLNSISISFYCLYLLSTKRSVSVSWVRHPTSPAASYYLRLSSIILYLTLLGNPFSFKMGMKLAERHTRDQTLFYMEQSVVNLSQNAVIVITKAPELKKFLLFLAEHEPRRMNGILKIVSEKASAAIVAIDAQKEKERNATKRAAPSDADPPETVKRAKLAAAVPGTGANIRVRVFLPVIVEDTDVKSSAELRRGYWNYRLCFR